MILNGIISEIKGSKCLFIMADEGTSHNNKECAFCIRFIDGDNYVRKEFIDFTPLTRITAEAIATAIRQTFEKLGLNIANMTG